MKKDGMNSQKPLFEPPKPLKTYQPVPDHGRFQAALLFGAVGDALGWPTEFLRLYRQRCPSFETPVRDFVLWHKSVGGRWWGYREEIKPGEYSDDTQLNLAVARCVSESGDFEPERFAYEELPLWLHYERGGGRSVKTAARSLVRGRVDWFRNFYKQGDLDYRNAGANGAAMRNLPIALVNTANEDRLVRDSFLNAVITHGHPRAILGAILFGLAARHAIVSHNGGINTTLIEYLRDKTEGAGRAVVEERRIGNWVTHWDTRSGSGKGAFRALFQAARQDTNKYLDAIRDFATRPVEDYYKFIGVLDPSTRGSGVATVCAAIYLFVRYLDEPERALYTAVNLFGSDTDTIACFLGALLGAYHGLGAVPKHLETKIQDRSYLLKTASRLHSIAAGDVQDQLANDRPVERREAYLRLLAWEVGLHEMFWDAIDVGGMVVHPTLGRGKITNKDVRTIPRQGYVAKLIHVEFDCGQTCVFHSRVENNERLSESLAKELEKILYPVSDKEERKATKQ
ncbi:MAG: ADP-ribosylglycohydrolase family protein [Acidobacteriia bacterium]|nr:ADP-ribosylglycohydrolase family protein [Terriglobia bacterium]